MRAPHSAQLRKFLIAAICVLPLILILIITSLNWQLWKVFFPLSSPNRFLDLELITFNAGCYSRNPMLDLKNIACDPAGRVFNYPRTMLEIASQIGLDSSQTFLLGILFQVSLIAVFLYLILTIFSNFDVSYSPRRLILTSLLITSPPVFFVLERGNTDSLMFVFVVLALSLVLFSQPIAICLVLVAFAIKLYPVGVIAPFLTTQRLRISGWFVVFIAGAWTAANFDDYLRVWNSSPLYEWYSFGLRAIPYQLTSYLPYALTGKSGVIVSQVLGFLLFLFCSVAVFWLIISWQVFGKSFSADLEKLGLLKSRESLLIQGTVSVFFLTYFMGLNWDTKMLFLIPFSLFFIFANSTRPLKVAIPLSVFWLSGIPNFLLLQTIGDLILTIYIVYILFLLIALRLTAFKKVLGISI